VLIVVNATTDPVCDVLPTATNVPGAIDAVNAHATSTLIGDTVEYQSIIDLRFNHAIYPE
jgi:3-oxoacyl-(acyl-carrier-protein) synthase